MTQPEILSVTWSAKGIRVVYTGEMVVHLSAEDIYPLAVKAEDADLKEGIAGMVEYLEDEGIPAQNFATPFTSIEAVV
jgi:hypothetical protein